jgi:Tol biopolymer transport system component
MRLTPSFRPSALRCAFFTVALATAAACTSSSLSSTTHAAFRAQPARAPIGAGELAAGPWDLFTWDPSSEESLCIAPGLAREGDAAFSPDGKWLVFSSVRDGDLDLWATRFSAYALPSPLIRLTPSSDLQYGAAFAPDGRSIAFVELQDGDADILVMPFRPENPVAAYAQARNLTRSPSDESRPAFSPDGRSIAFASDRDATRAAGASSDGASSSRRAAAPTEVYVMNADGTQPRRLTDAAGLDTAPVWSKDSAWIYFESERDGSPRIWSMRKDGSEQAAISPVGMLARSPALMVDGRIAFTSTDSAGLLHETWRIGSIYDDGTEARWETPLGLDCRAPVFQTKTNRLVCFGRTVAQPREAEEAELVSAAQH